MADGDILLVGQFKGVFGKVNESNREEDFRQICEFSKWNKAVFVQGGGRDANVCSLRELSEIVNATGQNIASSHPNLTGVVLCLGSSDCDSKVFSMDGFAFVFKKND